MKKFHVLGKSAWGGKPAKHVVPQSHDAIKTMVLHHTAGSKVYTKKAAAEEMRFIQHLHMDVNGWSDIGYNFVIDGMGRVWEGRGYYRVGAHTLGENTGTIGVSFMGNYEHDKLNALQRRALRNLNRRLVEKSIKIKRVKGHREMPNQATACPGKNIMIWMKRIRKMLGL